ncbi:Uncharacterised protein [Enterobacter cloacae]|nr:Uncharacterised protein [Enterobacter cloacae]
MTRIQRIINDDIKELFTHSKFFDMGKSMKNNVVFFIRLTLSKRLQANHREFAAVNNGNVNCFFILHWHSPFAE